MKTKKELIEKRDELQKEIYLLNVKIKELNKMELFEKYNVLMGDEITILGKKAVITNNCGNYIYYTAYKKDGTLGSRESRIWSFDTFIKNVSK
jgi:hypothetical protein